MSLRRYLALPVIFTAFAALVACGGSANNATPPPTGGFNNTNLNGTYVFATSGTDINGAPIMLTGTFAACGCSAGTISGGAFTFGSGSVGVGSNQAISGGSYRVTVDGRGQAQLKTATAFGTIVLDFVLGSNSQAMVTEYDGNGTGSGTLESQSTVSQSQLAGSFAFSATGAFLTSGATAGLLATAGGFTLDSAGAVTAGVQDITNLNLTTGAVSTQQALPIATTSTVLLGTGTTPGTAQIADTGAGSFKFDVYPVSATHLKFIETDGVDLTSGDAFTQQTSLPSGTLAFTMGGLDTSGGPLSIGGLLPNASGTISGGIEDYNDGGTANGVSSVSGSFTALSGGRSTLTLTAFVNGATNDTPGTYTFAAYPSTGGLILLDINNSTDTSAGITTGTALAQTKTTLAASQGYGMDLSASNIGGSLTGGTFEEDDIAEFTTTGSGFSGLVDVNDQGTLNFDQKINGSYQSTSTGRYNFTSNAFNGVLYTVDGSSLLFLETDNNQVGTGALLTQSTPGTSAAAVPHFALSHPVLSGRHAFKQLSN